MGATAKAFARAVLKAALLLGILCALLEQWARVALDRSDPPTGRRVNVGGRQLHLDCRGEGAPTVVLEAGLDGYGAAAWAPVHDALARQTRTCAYGRAGMPWSQPATGPVNAVSIAGDLHQLLERAGERGPYLLGAHSIGALYALTFAHRYPDEVAGMVLVDPTHPDQVALLRPLAPQLASPLPPPLRLLARLRWTGVPRALLALAPAPSANQAEVARQTARFGATALAAAAREADALEASTRAARGVCTPPHAPLIVLSAGRLLPPELLAAIDLDRARAAQVTRLMARLHSALAQCSATGRVERVADAGHYVQFDRPDRVIAAVHDVVRSWRATSPR